MDVVVEDATPHRVHRPCFSHTPPLFCDAAGCLKAYRLSPRRKRSHLPLVIACFAAGTFSLVGEGYCLNSGDENIKYAANSNVVDDTDCRAACLAAAECWGYFLSSTRCAIYAPPSETSGALAPQLLYKPKEK